MIFLGDTDLKWWGVSGLRRETGDRETGERVMLPRRRNVTRDWSPKAEALGLGRRGSTQETLRRWINIVARRGRVALTEVKLGQRRTRSKDCSQRQGGALRPSGFRKELRGRGTVGERVPSQSLHTSPLFLVAKLGSGMVKSLVSHVRLDFLTP